MRIGIAGPASADLIRKHLPADTDRLPDGMGGAPFLGTLIDGFLRAGHEVSVYTLDRELHRSRSTPLVFEGEKLRVYFGPYRNHSIRFNGKKLGRIVDLFRIERNALRQAMLLDRPDVVHAHWTYEYALAGLESGLPCLVTCHDSPLRVLRHMPNVYRAGRLLMAYLVLAEAKSLTAVSPYLAAELRRFTREPITVIPNPAPYRAIDWNPDRRALPTVTDPSILMVNNGWGKIKNVAVALRALPQIRDQSPGLSLHLCGTDYEVGGPAHHWAQRHDLDMGVVFHGRVSHDELLSLMSSSTALLHTSREESCPLALIEAMACSLPVVGGADSGGVPWILDNGTAGILTDIRSAGAVAKTVCGLLRSGQRQLRLREVARAHARSHFHPSRVIDSYLSAYRDLAGATRP